MAGDETAPLLGGGSTRRANTPTRLLAAVVFAVLCLAAVVTLSVLYSQSAQSLRDADRRAANARALTTECVLGEVQPILPLDGMHFELRAKLAQELSRALGANTTRAAILYMNGGSFEEHFFADTELPYWQEANFFWMTGYEKGDTARLVCLWEAEAGLDQEAALSCTLFVPRPTISFITWNGQAMTLPELRERYQVDNVEWIEDFGAVVAGLVANVTALEPNPSVHMLPFLTGFSTPAPAPLSALTENTTVLKGALELARIQKTASEIAMLQHAADASTHAHIAVMRSAKDSSYEFQVESTFVAVHTSCGLKQQSYLPIVASGGRGSILHYNTNMKPLEKNFLLIDAGGTFYGYGADITRSFPLDGRFSDEQRTIYNIVLDAQTAAIENYVTGALWTKAQDAAFDTLLVGLAAHGLVNGTLAELKAARIQSVFMPHSLGHHLGLDVHDPAGPGGIGECRSSEDPDEPVRCPGTLRPNMVLTAEPGCYFVPELIEQALANPTQSKFINAAEVARYTEAGASVRIEDIVHVQAQGPPVLLSADIPRTADDIEALIAS